MIATAVFAAAAVSVMSRARSRRRNTSLRRTCCDSTGGHGFTCTRCRVRSGREWTGQAGKKEKGKARENVREREKRGRDVMIHAYTRTHVKTNTRTHTHKHIGEERRGARLRATAGVLQFRILSSIRKRLTPVGVAFKFYFSFSIF